MPDPGAFGTPWIEAHLDLTVDSGGHSASARLQGDSAGLVVDVDRPAVLLTEFRRLRGDVLVRQALQQMLPDVPVSVQCQGRYLGRITLRANGRIAARPSLAGVRALTVVALDSRSVRLAAAAVSGALLVGLLGARRNRRG